ncbi:hypothetical protein ACQZV8_03050 [Magnetococcales bacterium HHB-1]
MTESQKKQAGKKQLASIRFARWFKRLLLTGLFGMFFFWIVPALLGDNHHKRLKVIEEKEPEHVAVDAHLEIPFRFRKGSELLVKYFNVDQLHLKVRGKVTLHTLSPLNMDIYFDQAEGNPIRLARMLSSWSDLPKEIAEQLPFKIIKLHQLSALVNAEGMNLRVKKMTIPNGHFEDVSLNIHQNRSWKLHVAKAYLDLPRNAWVGWPAIPEGRLQDLKAEAVIGGDASFTLKSFQVKGISLKHLTGHLAAIKGGQQLNISMKQGALLGKQIWSWLPQWSKVARLWQEHFPDIALKNLRLTGEGDIQKIALKLKLDEMGQIIPDSWRFSGKTAVKNLALLWKKSNKKHEKLLQWPLGEVIFGEGGRASNRLRLQSNVGQIFGVQLKKVALDGYMAEHGLAGRLRIQSIQPDLAALWLWGAQLKATQSFFKNSTELKKKPLKDLLRSAHFKQLDLKWDKNFLIHKVKGALKDPQGGTIDLNVSQFAWPLNVQQSVFQLAIKKFRLLSWRGDGQIHWHKGKKGRIDLKLAMDDQNQIDIKGDMTLWNLPEPLKTVWMHGLKIDLRHLDIKYHQSSTAETEATEIPWEKRFSSEDLPNPGLPLQFWSRQIQIKPWPSLKNFQLHWIPAYGPHPHTVTWKTELCKSFWNGQAQMNLEGKSAVASRLQIKKVNLSNLIACGLTFTKENKLPFFLEGVSFGKAGLTLQGDTLQAFWDNAKADLSLTVNQGRIMGVSKIHDSASFMMSLFKLAGLNKTRLRDTLIFDRFFLRGNLRKKKTTLKRVQFHSKSLQVQGTGSVDFTKKPILFKPQLIVSSEISPIDKTFDEPIPLVP